MEILESFAYSGRNRRSEQCMFEKLIELAKDEQEAISAHAAKYGEQLRVALQTLGILIDQDIFDAAAWNGDAPRLFASWYANTALAIQKAAGHRVNYATTLDDPDPNRKRVLFEYEQGDVALQADLLALELLTSIIHELDWSERPEDRTDSFTDSFAEFVEFARPFILPPDAQAIIDAARELDIPCVKLEREPYENLVGDFRIRMNGLLKLGHSEYQHIVDGTFCIDREQHLFPLLKDREKRIKLLTQLQVPVPRQGGSTELKAPVIEGDSYKVIVANGEIIGVVSVRDGEDVRSETHPSTLDMVLKLIDQLGAGLLVVDVVTTRIGSPLQDCDGAVVDVDIAPQLDRFLVPGCELHARAMSGFLQWLYPAQARSRIPLVAVTGTNGKTTTSQMITRIMQAAHFQTGFAGSRGVFINHELIETRDSAGSRGHHKVLESQEVNLGVLETARGGLAYIGFMFDWCNVSVCLNVTEDHLGQYGIETVDQMAALKRSVLESARDAVVLNADDPRCIDMLPYLSVPRVCLVSMQSGVEALLEIPGNTACFCILENISGSDWLVLYVDGQKMPVIEVSGIPATHGGLARFNICNALHAIAACYLVGADLQTVEDGLSKFNTDFETLRGRLNIYDKHPFRVIMDYAHNADGFRNIIEFTEGLQVTGRKILMVGYSGDRKDADIKAAATILAGHFDHYVCRPFPDTRGRPAHEAPTLLKSGLISQGIPESDISIVFDAVESVRHSLAIAEAGDLVILLVGSHEFKSTWETISRWDTSLDRSS